MTILSAYINGIGLLGPGLPGWPESRSVLAGRQIHNPSPVVLPVPSLLPAAERRRSGDIIKLALAVGLEAALAAAIEPAVLPCVYTASGGDGYNCHEICQMLATADRHISPTRFHNSVHNAAAGYWGIATGAMLPVSVLGASDASFGAGLLETLAMLATQYDQVLLIACDTPYPEPLHTVRPLPGLFGMAMVLSSAPGPRSCAQIRVRLSDEPADTLVNDSLETLRRGIPAARCLPLLQALAVPHTARVILDYLDQKQIDVTIVPC